MIKLSNSVGFGQNDAIKLGVRSLDLTYFVFNFSLNLNGKFLTIK
jgi:hypothetical protein